MKDKNKYYIYVRIGDKAVSLETESTSDEIGKEVIEIMEDLKEVETK